MSFMGFLGSKSDSGVSLRVVIIGCWIGAKLEEGVCWVTDGWRLWNVTVVCGFFERFDEEEALERKT